MTPEAWVNVSLAPAPRTTHVKGILDTFVVVVVVVVFVVVVLLLVLLLLLLLLFLFPGLPSMCSWDSALVLNSIFAVNIMQYSL